MTLRELFLVQKYLKKKNPPLNIPLRFKLTLGEMKILNWLAYFAHYQNVKGIPTGYEVFYNRSAFPILTWSRKLIIPNQNKQKIWRSQGLQYDPAGSYWHKTGYQEFRDFAMNSLWPYVISEPLSNPRHCVRWSKWKDEQHSPGLQRAHH